MITQRQKTVRLNLAHLVMAHDIVVPWQNGKKPNSTNSRDSSRARAKIYEGRWQRRMKSRRSEKRWQRRKIYALWKKRWTKVFLSSSAAWIPSSKYSSTSTPIGSKNWRQPFSNSRPTSLAISPRAHLEITEPVRLNFAGRFSLIFIFFVSICKTESLRIRFNPTLLKSGLVFATFYITVARDNRFFALCVEEYFSKLAVYDCEIPSHIFDYILNIASSRRRSGIREVEPSEILAGTLSQSCFIIAL